MHICQLSMQSNVSLALLRSRLWVARIGLFVQQLALCPIQYTHVCLMGAKLVRLVKLCVCECQLNLRFTCSKDALIHVGWRCTDLLTCSSTTRLCRSVHPWERVSEIQSIKGTCSNTFRSSASSHKTRILARLDLIYTSPTGKMYWFCRGWWNASSNMSDTACSHARLC